MEHYTTILDLSFMTIAARVAGSRIDVLSRLRASERGCCNPRDQMGEIT